MALHEKESISLKEFWYSSLQTNKKKLLKKLKKVSKIKLRRKSIRWTTLLHFLVTYLIFQEGDIRFWRCHKLLCFVDLSFVNSFPLLNNICTSNTKFKRIWKKIVNFKYKHLGNCCILKKCLYEKAFPCVFYMPYFWIISYLWIRRMFSAFE